MAMHGDLWAFGTSPVEQRSARLKKFVRNVVSWRPYQLLSVTVRGSATRLRSPTGLDSSVASQ
eukprot:1189464-Prymnesium_polylepis.1